MQAKKVVLTMGSTPAECSVVIDGVKQTNVAGFAATLSIEEGPNLMLQRATGQSDSFEEIEFPEAVIEHEAETMTVEQLTERLGEVDG